MKKDDPYLLIFLLFTCFGGAIAWGIGGFLFALGLAMIIIKMHEPPTEH